MFFNETDMHLILIKRQDKPYAHVFHMDNRGDQNPSSFQELSNTALETKFDSPTPKVVSMLVMEVISICWFYSLICPSKIFGVNHNFSVSLQGS